jgi:hypothetical protein
VNNVEVNGATVTEFDILEILYLTRPGIKIKENTNTVMNLLNRRIPISNFKLVKNLKNVP